MILVITIVIAIRFLPLHWMGKNYHVLQNLISLTLHLCSTLCTCSWMNVLLVKIHHTQD